MKKYLFVVCCLLLVFVITGCSFDDKLSSKEEIINSVNLSLPDAKFIKLEEIDVSGSDHITKEIDYHFNINSINFTVSNYLYLDEYARTAKEHVSDTYMENVWNKKSIELEGLFDKYSGVEKSTDYGAIYFTPVNYQDFDTLDKFLDEYLDLLKGYLPYENGSIESDITIALDIPNIELYGPEKMSINKPLYVDTLEEVKNNSIKELQEKYLKNVELGYINDNTINN